MPSLSDLFGINAAALNTTPQRMRNLPPAPEGPGVMGKPFSPEYLQYQKPTSEWDYASGRLETPMVSPDDLIGTGIPTKLAALAKGSIPALAAGIMKPKGGVWLTDSLPPRMKSGKMPYDTSGIQRFVNENASKAERDIIESRFGKIITPDEDDLYYSEPLARAVKQHYEDPSFLPFIGRNPEVAADRWYQGPLAKYITRDMATEGDPIRALAEEGITHLGSGQIKRMPSADKQLIVDNRISQGFPPEETANTRLGKIWERIADNAVVPWRKNEYGDTVFQYMNQGAFNPKSSDGLDRLVELVKNGIRRGEINPGAASRGSFTVSDAVRYADAERRLAERNLASPDVFKEYPETGHRWFQLNKPGQFDAESDVMKNSVRGYEPTSVGGDSYGLGGFPAIESGRAKIFSLRDPAGKSIVNAEIEALPDGSHRVVQVKGRANTAPKPEYSQMIEDLKRQFEQQ